MRQERFASSFNRGLLANLVAKRVSIVSSPEERELIWFLQRMSWSEEGLSHFPAGGLERYCLDPNARLDAGALAAIQKFRAGLLARESAGRVQTGIGRRISEALEYTRSARTISVIDGPSRIGKSFEARLV